MDPPSTKDNTTSPPFRCSPHCIWRGTIPRRSRHYAPPRDRFIASLDTLPEEIIDLILEHVTDDITQGGQPIATLPDGARRLLQQTFLAVVLTCRALVSPGLRALFRAPYISGMYDDLRESSRHRIWDKVPSFQRAISTVTRNFEPRPVPALALAVRDFSCLTDILRYSPTLDSHNVLPGCTNVTALGLSFDLADTGAFYVRTLPCLPNVEYLRISLEEGGERYYSGEDVGESLNSFFSAWVDKQQQHEKASNEKAGSDKTTTTTTSGIPYFPHVEIENRVDFSRRDRTPQEGPIRFKTEKFTLSLAESDVDLAPCFLPLDYQSSLLHLCIRLRTTDMKRRPDRLGTRDWSAALKGNRFQTFEIDASGSLRGDNSRGILVVQHGIDEYEAHNDFGLNIVYHSSLFRQFPDARRFTLQNGKQMTLTELRELVQASPMLERIDLAGTTWSIDPLELELENVAAHLDDSISAADFLRTKFNASCAALMSPFEKRLVSLLDRLPNLRYLNLGIFPYVEIYLAAQVARRPFVAWAEGKGLELRLEGCKGRREGEDRELAALVEKRNQVYW
ncbi:hypothetical protein JCM10908_003119 [Rhodotorula pacifica]|uniref:uncharacterized protein n=1 Tax=Rhodotorula pacifica TaxID=1495444 RepID=UPI00317EE3C5